MMRRIFVAIPLSEKVKADLALFQKEYSELPAKWVKPENLHITLEFLGNRSDEEIGEICGKVQGIAAQHSAFTLILKNIIYGPPGKTPRMVWATGEATKELNLLAKDIKQALSGSNAPITLHITLARITQWEFRKTPEEERIDVSKDINIQIPVDSIFVMESRLKKGGTEYTVLQEEKLQ